MAQSSKLPINPIGMYWAYWNPYTRLSLLPTTYNIIYLFHAYPATGEAVGGDTGAVVLRKPSGTIGDNLNADIVTCRARGQRILVSIGGAGGQTYIQTKARADAFIQSIKDINVGLGGSGTTAAFDGIDWNNFEGANIAGQSTWMTYAGQQLKAYYGTDFLITSPPAASFFNSQNTIDRLLLAELYAGNALDWMCPQFYDGDGTNTQSNVLTQLDFYNTAVTVNGQTVQIPRSNIGIGYRIDSLTTSWTATSAAAAYTAAVNAGKTPKGAFNWAVHLDTNNQFASVVAPVITNNTGSTIEIELAASANITQGGSTTAQLTPPTGKTMAAFQAGVVTETANPVAVDLAADNYTEVEWSLRLTSLAQDAAQYEFRVTDQGQALDGYVATPTITVGTSGGQPNVDPPNTGGPYLTFDGDGDYIEVPNSTDFSIDTTGEITISALMRPDALLFTDTESAGAEGTYVMWLGKGGYHTVNNLEWGFRMYSNDGNRPNRISFYVFNLVGGLGVGSYFQDTVVAGEWIRVTAKVDATYTYIYKNGTLRDQDEYPSYPIVPEHSYEPMRFGTMTKSSSWLGALKDVIIWNRALTNSEVLGLESGVVPGSGMVGRWKMDEGSGNTVVDSVNGRNGTLYPGNGQPAWVTGSVTPPTTNARTIQGVSSFTGLSSIVI